MTTRVPYSMTSAPANVRAFGAKGDGTTNDTAAFTLCRAATGGRYVIPPGTYVVDASPNVWEDTFAAPLGGTSLVIGGVTYDISGAFGSGWKTSNPATQRYLYWTHARTGQTIAIWSDGEESGDSHRFFLPFDVRRNSHFFIAAPATNGGATDLLFRRSAANADPQGNRFQITFTEGTSSDVYDLLVATTASGAPSFDAAYQVTSGPGGLFAFPALPVEVRQSLAFVKRSGATYKWRLVPEAATMALKSQDTSNVDQSTLVTYAQHAVTTGNKRQGTFAALPYTDRAANSFSEAGNLASGASRVFPLVAASHFASGKVNLVMVGSGGGDRYYQVDFKCDGTTLTTDASTLNAGSAELTVAFAVASGQLELTLGYTGGLGASARYALDVDVVIVNR
jgi:hypothetical protein